MAKPFVPSSSGVMPIPASMGVRLGPAISPAAEPFIGAYAWRGAPGDVFFEFEAVRFSRDGTYAARVEATLLNDAVRSFGARCTLREEGTWNVYRVTGQARMRLRPTTGRARVYVVAGDAGALVLSRRGGRSILRRRDDEDGTALGVA